MDVSLNRRFHELRKLLNYTQKDIASKLSISQGSVTDIERCRIGLSNKIIEKMVKELEISKSWLYTGDGLPFLDVEKNENYVILQGENTGYNTGVTAESEKDQILKRGIEISNKLGNNDEALFTGYYDDNKLAFYLRHTDTRLDGLLSVAISNLKDIHNAISKLIAFINNVGAPDFIQERFKMQDDFETYMTDEETVFNEVYEHIKDEKVLKCTRLIEYEQKIEDNRDYLISIINYVDRYDDFFKGHKDFEKANSL